MPFYASKQRIIARLLLLASSTGMDSFAETATTGLTPAQFDSILERECHSELLSLEDSEQLTWNASTERAWKMCTSTSAPMASPFVVCYSAPGLSGNKRRKAVEAMFLAQNAEETGSSGDSTVTFSKHAIYNGDGKTCFLVQSPGNVANSVAAGGDTSFLHVQPLLPMAKVPLGTVESAMKKCSPSGAKKRATVRIDAIFSPNVKEGKMEAEAAQTVFRAITGRGGKIAQEQLLDAFPNTGPSMMSKSYEPETAEERIEARHLKSTAKDPCIDIYGQITIATAGGNLNIEIHSPQDDATAGSVTAMKVLSFISGLAAHPLISSIEIPGDLTGF